MNLEISSIVDFSPDATKIVSYYYRDGKIQIWRTNDGKKIKEIKTAKNGKYSRPIKYSPDGSKIASIGGELLNTI